MQSYVLDYRRETARLSCAEHGAYIRLILDYWVNGPPPDDDDVLARITKTSKKEWKKLRINVIGFFRISDGICRHKRIDHELDRANSIIAQKQSAGRAGAEARWGKTDGRRIADAMADAMAEPMAEAMAEGMAEAM